MTDGETYEAALTNVQTIMGQRIQTARELGREIPKPPRTAGVGVAGCVTHWAGSEWVMFRMTQEHTATQATALGTARTSYRSE